MTPIRLVVALTLSVAGMACHARSDLALLGATLYDGTGTPPVADSVVLISGTRIDCAGSADRCDASSAGERRELAGKYLTPGLIDAHVHFSQTGWLDGRPDSGIRPPQFDYARLQQSLREDPDRWHRTYLCSGVTAVLDVGGFPWTIDYEASAEQDARRARYRAAGPLITHADNPWLRADGSDQFLPMGSDDEALAGVAKLQQWGSRYVKVWFLDPPPAQRGALEQRLQRVGEEATRRGMQLIVHATELANAKAALRAGAFLLVHSVEDAAIDEEFIALLKARDTIYAPTLLVGRNWTRALMSAALGLAPAIDDARGCVDAETRRLIAAAPALKSALPEWGSDFARIARRYEGVGTELQVMTANLGVLYRAGATIATATDAGNPMTLHGVSIHEEMEAMQAVGIAPRDLIVMSTHNGARAMQRTDIGTVEAGKLADLLVLDQDPGADVRAFRGLSLLVRGGVMHDPHSFSAPGSAEAVPGASSR